MDSSQEQLTDENIHSAVELWYNNKNMALNVHGNISDWDTSKVTNMKELFKGLKDFNDDINNWNVGKVTTMMEMFSGASVFNQPLDKWNVSNVTDMSMMFMDASAFNQPIGNWNVGNVTRMGGMFGYAYSFNQPIGEWDVSNVTITWCMFCNADSFNQPIGEWDVGNVTLMQSMFNGASAFNQPLNQWNVGNVINMENMFDGAINMTSSRPHNISLPSPECMSFLEYRRCSKNDEGEIQDPISYQNIERKNAIMLPSLKGNKNCFDRNFFLTWVNTQRNNNLPIRHPMTNEVIDDNWIRENIENTNECVEEKGWIGDNEFGGKKRKTKKRKIKTSKKKRKQMRKKTRRKGKKTKKK